MLLDASNREGPFRVTSVCGNVARCARDVHFQETTWPMAEQAALRGGWLSSRKITGIPHGNNSF